MSHTSLRRRCGMPFATALKSKGSSGCSSVGSRAHFTQLNRQIEQIASYVPTFVVQPYPADARLRDSAHHRQPGDAAGRCGECSPLGGRPVPSWSDRSPRLDVSMRSRPPIRLIQLSRLCAQSTPLQPTEFTAAWTLASVVSLTAAGVSGGCVGSPVGQELWIKASDSVCSIRRMMLSSSRSSKTFFQSSLMMVWRP